MAKSPRFGCRPHDLCRTHHGQIEAGAYDPQYDSIYGAWRLSLTRCVEAQVGLDALVFEKIWSKGTAAARHLPADFASLKHRFLLRPPCLPITSRHGELIKIRQKWSVIVHFSPWGG